MPTIGAKVNLKELDAIVEYANLCGEIVSNVIRKVTIADAGCKAQRLPTRMDRWNPIMPRHLFFKGTCQTN